MRHRRPGIILFGAPLDLTSSYRTGTRLGPQQIRAAGEGLEDYSLALDRDVRQVKVID
ncbi:MAG: arginase family protein, partial [Candidatus Methylomirabilales bacterium]